MGCIVPVRVTGSSLDYVWEQSSTKHFVNVYEEETAERHQVGWRVYVSHPGNYDNRLFTAESGFVVLIWELNQEPALKTVYEIKVMYVYVCASVRVQVFPIKHPSQVCLSHLGYCRNSIQMLGIQHQHLHQHLNTVQHQNRKRAGVCQLYLINSH